MMNEAKYTIVGRYMDGIKVAGYHLLENDGSARRFSREQVIYLVGRGDVANCKGQIYKEEVLLRGVGVNLNDLPVVNDRTGGMKNTENLGRVARGATTEQALAQFLIVGRIVVDGKTIGFTVRNAGGVEYNLKREKVELMASKLMIGNARVQTYKGRNILRMMGCAIADLPVTKRASEDEVEVHGASK